MEFCKEKNRRKCVSRQRDIQPFRKSLCNAKFIHRSALESHVSDEHQENSKPNEVKQGSSDMYWLWKLQSGNTPLHAGFMSRYYTDQLPFQRICYMDPILQSPTNNHVVRETMVRSLNIAEETNQKYAVVTYDLAIA